MVISALSPCDLDELRRYVERTICIREQFELGAFPISERALVQGGRRCGISFCLHGPRQVKFTALWEAETNSVLFYNCQGERIGRRWLPAPIALGPLGSG